MNNILLSGYTSFIGTHFVTALTRQEKHTRDISRKANFNTTSPAVELNNVDVTIPATLRDVPRYIDTILHAAGHTHELSSRLDNHYLTTLEGTRNLLAHTIKQNVNRSIFSSASRQWPHWVVNAFKKRLALYYSVVVLKKTSNISVTQKIYMAAADLARPANQSMYPQS